MSNVKTPNLVAELAAMRKNLIAGNKQYSARIDASKASYAKGQDTTNPDLNLDTRVKDTRSKWEGSNSSKYEDRVKKGESNWFTNTVVFDEPEPPKQKYTVTLYNILCDVDGGGVFEEGSTCVVRAILYDSSKYEFKGWYNEAGQRVSQDLIYSFTVTADTFLYAVARVKVDPKTSKSFLGAVCDHGNVTFDPVGCEAVQDAGWYYDATTNVTLTANVVSGYEFVAWINENGETVSTNPSFTTRVVVETGKYHDTRFVALTQSIRPEEYWITADAVHGVVRGAGSYKYGEIATLRVTPDEGYKFLNWTDGDHSNPRYHYVTGNAAFVAVCTKEDPTPPEPDQILIEYSAVNGSVQVSGVDPQSSGEGYGYYHYGDEIKLTCNPWFGYHFVAWSDGCGTQERNETVKARASYVAICEIDTPSEEKCTVYTAGANCVVSGAGTYDWGTLKTFVCTPNVGYTFQGWYVDGIVQTESSTSLTLVIPEKETCEVHAYCIPSYTPTVDYAAIIGLGVNGTVTGSGLYPAGTDVRLEFHPDAEIEFVEWTTETGLHVSSSNPYTVSVTSDMVNQTWYYVAQSESVDPERKRYDLTVTSKNGTITVNPDKARYSYGDSVTVTFAPADTYKFDRFVVNGNPVFTNPVTIKIFGDTAIDAIGVKQVDPQPGKYELYLEAVPAAGGVIAFSVDESTEAETTSTVLQIPADSNVQLYAREVDDYEFAHWSDYATVSPSRAFAMPAYPMTIAAYFESEEKPKASHHVRLLCTDGDLKVKIGTGEYVNYYDCYDVYLAEDTEFTVDVDPHGGHVFGWWYDGGKKTKENPRVFKVAHSEIEDHAFCAAAKLTVSTIQSDKYSVAQQGKEISHEAGLDYGTYIYGELCKVTCTPAAGYYFSKWVRTDTNGETTVSTANPYYFFVEESVTLKPYVHQTAVRVITEEGKKSDIYLDISHDTRAAGARPSLQFSIDEGTSWTDVPTSADAPMQFTGTLLLRSSYTDIATSPTWAAFYGTEGEDSRVGDYSRIAFGTKPGDTSFLTLEGNLSTLQNISDDSKNLGYCRNKTGACAYIFCNNTYIKDITNLNLPSRVSGDDSHNYLCFDCFQSLFENCNHISAWDQGENPTALPNINAVNAGSFAFHSMYKGCTAIKQAPVYCGVTGVLTQQHWSGMFQSMFEGCTSLIRPLEINMTYLGHYACMQMYDGCTSLTYMPAMPKEKDSKAQRYAYKWMFRNCVNLQAVVPLENELVLEESYYGMFEGCTSLTDTPRLQILCWYDKPTHACAYMFKGCVNLEHIYIAVGPYNDNTLNWLEGAGTNTLAKGKTPWFMTPKTNSYDGKTSYVANQWRDAGRDVSHCPSSFKLVRDYFTIIPSSNLPYTLKITAPANSGGASKERFRWFFLDTEYDNTFVTDERSAWPHLIDINRGETVTLTFQGIACIMDVNEKGDGGPWTYSNSVVQLSLAENKGMTFEICGSTYWLTRMAKSDSTRVCSNLLSVSAPEDANITEARHLFLPDLGDEWTYGYEYMLRHQSKLKTFPYFSPNINFSQGKFYGAFEGCSSVEYFTSPYIGGKNRTYIVPIECFCETFKDCTSLKYSPVLNIADIRNKGCYGMFQGCTHLTDIPTAHRSITVGESACENMLRGCSSLVHTNFAVSTVNKRAYAYMYAGCTSLGSDSSYPTMLETISAIPEECFLGTFQGCTSLKYPMNFSNIASVGVRGMAYCYDGCSSVTGCSSVGNTGMEYISLSTESLKCVYRNSGLKSGYNLPSINVVSGSNLNSALESCFEGCTKFVYAPSIPHIVAPHGVSNQIFKRAYAGCTSLEATPTMYCRRLDENAFIEMYDGCKALYAVHTQGLVVDDASIANWLRDVRDSGVFYCPLGSQVDKNAYVPTGWAKLATESPTIDTLGFSSNVGDPAVLHTFSAKFNDTTHARSTEIMNGMTMYGFVDIEVATNVCYSTTKTLVNGSVIWKVDGVEWSIYINGINGGSFNNSQFVATANGTREYYVLGYNDKEIKIINQVTYYPVLKGLNKDVYYVTTVLPAAGGKVYSIVDTTVTEYATINFVTAEK